MTVKLSMLEERIKFIVDEMKESNLKIGEKGEDGFVPMEITIDNAFDVLNLFHAGVRCGLYTAYPSTKVS